MITIRFANLANILADRLIIPELLQEDCTPEKYPPLCFLC